MKCANIVGMDAYETLRRDAKKARDVAIALARARYKRAVNHINQLQSGMGTCKFPMQVSKIRRSPVDTPFNKLTMLEAAERVLLERGPLSVVELTVEIQGRGLRANDLPYKVAAAIKSAFHYHKDRFVRDETYRWIVV
jgi:hypothetical protein